MILAENARQALINQTKDKLNAIHAPVDRSRFHADKHNVMYVVWAVTAPKVKLEPAMAASSPAKLVLTTIEEDKIVRRHAFPALQVSKHNFQAIQQIFAVACSFFSFRNLFISHSENIFIVTFNLCFRYIFCQRRCRRVPTVPIPPRKC